MKLILCLFTFAAVFAIYWCKPETNLRIPPTSKSMTTTIAPPLHEPMTVEYEECNKKFNMTSSEVLKKIHMGERIPPNCFLKCFAEKSNFIREGKYDLEMLHAIFVQKPMYVDKEEELQKALHDCDKLSNSSDVCKYARKMTLCIFFGHKDAEKAYF